MMDRGQHLTIRYATPCVRQDLQPVPRQVPDIKPSELNELQQSKSDLVVVDVRMPEEQQACCT